MQMCANHNNRSKQAYIGTKEKIVSKSINTRKLFYFVLSMFIVTTLTFCINKSMSAISDDFARIAQDAHPGGDPDPAVIKPSIRARENVYFTGNSITIEYSGLHDGEKRNWISIVPVGASRKMWYQDQWAWTTGTHGSHTFTKTLPVGNYEARVYLDWDYVNDDGFTVEAHAPFTIDAPAH